MNKKLLSTFLRTSYDAFFPGLLEKLQLYDANCALCAQPDTQTFNGYFLPLLSRPGLRLCDMDYEAVVKNESDNVRRGEEFIVYIVGLLFDGFEESVRNIALQNYQGGKN